MNFEQIYLESSIKQFHSYKKLAEKAISQLDDDALLYKQLDEESNSIAIIMQHLAGNMISRWTDFLTSDGEKPNRDRDQEFEDQHLSKNDLMNYWEKGWEVLFNSLEGVNAANFDTTIYIRSEAHSIPDAINRQLTHYAYHIGQIVFLAKHWKNQHWESLSIPRGKSAAFNNRLSGKGDNLKRHCEGQYNMLI